MQTANIMVALGGDKGTLVPKRNVTVAEIAVLMEIHGNDAVLDIEPSGEIERTAREEIKRLVEIYGSAKKQGPNGDVHIVSALYPGVGARVQRSLDELEIPEEFFKAEKRMKPKAAKDPLDHDENGKKGGSKPRKKAEDEPEDDGKLFD